MFSKFTLSRPYSSLMSAPTGNPGRGRTRTGRRKTLHLAACFALLSLFLTMRFKHVFVPVPQATFIHAKMGAGWTYGNNQGMLRQDSELATSFLKHFRA